MREYQPVVCSILEQVQVLQSVLGAREEIGLVSFRNGHLDRWKKRKSKKQWESLASSAVTLYLMSDSELLTETKSICKVKKWVIFNRKKIEEERNNLVLLHHLKPVAFS